MNMKELAKLAKDAGTEGDCDILLISGGMEPELAEVVCALIDDKDEERKAILAFVLTTEGGDADAAFKIARSIQRYYEKSIAVVPGWCKSAGTLVCIAANELHMGRHGELGPLDVQLAKPDDLGGRASGLTFDSAFRSLQTSGFNMFEKFFLDTIRRSGGRITTKTSAEIASNVTTGLLAPVFAQFDPNKIGDDYRSTRVAEEYAARLNMKPRNLKSDETVDGIGQLVHGYPSHGFVIDREEASELFVKVQPIRGAMKALTDALGEMARAPRSSSRSEAPLASFLTDLPILAEEPTENETDGTPDRTGKGGRAKRSAANGKEGEAPREPAKG